MIHSSSFEIFFCLFVVYFFSVLTQRQHRIQAPLCAPLTPLPRLFLSTTSSCFLLFLVSTIGALACAACVCVWVCMPVCGCVGVKASLCMLAGIGSNPGVPFTHLLWNQQSGFQAPLSPSTKLSLCPARPAPSSPPNLSLARLPHLVVVLSPACTLQRKHGFHTAKKEQGCNPTPPCRIYLY